MNSFTTNNLLLRQFGVNDLTDTYMTALNDPEIVGLTEARYKRWERDNIIKYIKDSNKESKSMLIGIFLKTNNKPIGNIRLFNFHRIHKRCELGIMLYDKTEWGKGYGTEALSAVVNFVFSELKLHRIVADYYAMNVASSRIFMKAGFVVEGIFKDHFYVNGKFTDSIRVAKVNVNLEGTSNDKI